MAVLREGQSNEVPSVDFISYMPISLDISAFEITTDSDLYADPDDTTPPVTLGTFDRMNQQNCKLIIQVKSFSNNGLLDLQSLCSFARSSTAIAIFDAAHVAFVECDSVRNMQFLDDNQYRPCFMSQFSFMIALTRTEALNAILTINTTGDVTGNVGTIDGSIVVDLS